MSNIDTNYKKILEELNEIKQEMRQRCGESKEDIDEFFIPGKSIEINDKIESKYITPSLRGVNGSFDGSFDIMLNDPNNVDYPDFLAPTLVAFHTDDYISVDCIAMINTSFNLDHESIKFYYNLSLDSSGQHMINFFMAFKHKRNPQNPQNLQKVKSYRSHTFNLKIYKGAFNFDDDRYLPIEKIKSIEMYVVNKNPEGSRGTTTTVKDSGTE